MPNSALKRKRLALGLTQAAVADILFMSQSAYSKLENQKVTLSLQQAQRIAHVFHCTIAELAEGQMHDEENMSRAVVDHLVDEKLDLLKQWMMKQFHHEISGAEHYT